MPSPNKRLGNIGLGDGSLGRFERNRDQLGSLRVDLGGIVPDLDLGFTDFGMCCRVVEARNPGSIPDGDARHRILARFVPWVDIELPDVDVFFESGHENQIHEFPGRRGQGNQDFIDTGNGVDDLGINRYGFCHVEHLTTRVLAQRSPQAKSPAFREVPRRLHTSGSEGFRSRAILADRDGNPACKTSSGRARSGRRSKTGSCTPGSAHGGMESRPLTFLIIFGFG